MGTDALGIDDGWWGADGVWHDADPDTVASLRERLTESAQLPSAPYWFVDPAEGPALQSRCSVRLDDGTWIEDLDALPRDLPYGVHELHPADGSPPSRLVSAPTRLATWPANPTWGLAVQVYSAMSSRSWGIGDLDDLAAVGRWAGTRGATVLGINPLADPVPVTPRQPSPYSPSSRSFLDPLILPFDEAEGPGAAVSSELVDRDLAWSAKVAALRARWESLPPDERSSLVADVDAGLRAPVLDRSLWHGVFDHLAVHHQSGWHRWPAGLRDPGSLDVVEHARRHVDEVAFWCWVDGTCEAALAETRAALDLYGVSIMGDLPVGVAADGFDAWFDQEVMVTGWRVGAPPDPLGPAGQDWGLPPYDPHLLRAAGYEPFLATLRASFGRYGGLRIDHVMGLFRLFWIPPGGDPSHGTYVRTRPGELLGLVVAEAARHGAFVVGEDLGTVEDQVRRACRDRGVAGTKVAWFEPEAPESWPAASLGTLTTHDLPTTAGALSGTDPAADAGMVEAMRTFAGGVDERAGVDEVLVAAHRRLARSGSALVLATLEDVVGSQHRVNLPGTVDEYPNWRVRLPVDADRLHESPTAEAVAQALGDARPSPHP